MAIDPEQALGTEFTTGLTHWNREDVALYHLALGAGAQYCDEAELGYVDVRPLKILPTFAVLATSGIVQEMITHPGLQFDLGRAVHGEQHVELRRPIPPEAKVTNTARVANIFDKGSGALIVLEVETRDEAGEVLYLNRRNIFARGQGGFGGDPGPKSNFQLPQREPDLELQTPTLPQQALLYARASGENSRLHMDPEHARKVGFDGPIMHGLCTFGMVCKTVIDQMLDGDVGRVAGCRTRFAGPVYPGETLLTRLWRGEGEIMFESAALGRGTAALSQAVITLNS